MKKSQVKVIEAKARKIMKIDGKIWDKYNWQSGSDVDKEIYKMEKTYAELSPKARRGMNKYSRMSVEKMRKLASDFERKTGRNPNNVELKEEFFTFVANSH